MRLTRLKLLGFKSFVETTEFLIEPGLTGVVGPNGCGKSNLVEALRWVMGESSHKNLRATEMDQVIFAGSAGRPARNTAEVILTVENKDRTAPAAFNDTDLLEVSRRIERDQGSTYRINGREVRARDVQLLFADASTGARSPAMVRQGQIAELIAAKPQARRRILEEAAGVSGLHTRRHEAELRLKGAEQNLERLEDVLAQIEAQLESLKRQSRQAVRYRALSADIRRAEAGLFLTDFEEAGRDVIAAERKLDADIRAVAECTRGQSEATRLAAVAAHELPPLREAEAVAGAALQRLTIAREQLQTEEKRAVERQEELVRRIAQGESDIAREKALIADSAMVLERLANEERGLAKESEAGDRLGVAARQREAAAEQALHRAESLMGDKQAALADLQARQAQVERSQREAAERIARIDRQIADVERDRLAAVAEAGQSAALQGLRDQSDAAQAAIRQAEAAALAAEAAHGAAREGEIRTRGPLQEAEKHAARIETEARTLAKLITAPAGARHPPVLEAITVTRGHEIALGAALGDDLDLPLDPAALAHWGGGSVQPDDPALPDGVIPLSTVVRAPDALARRLAQIGLVEKADAADLIGRLKPGQRLVTREGHLWRWDGLVVAAGAPTAAGRRLVEKNRLGELEAQAGVARAAVAPLRQAAESAQEALRQAAKAEQTARDTWRAATRTAEQIRDKLAASERQAAQLASKLSGLEEAALRLAASREEALVAERAALAMRAALPDASALSLAFNEVRAEVAQCRGEMAEARAAVQTLVREAEMRDRRLKAIAAERASWQDRHVGGTAQLAALAGRLDELRTEQDLLADAPAAFAAQRRLLTSEAEAAELKRRAAADALAVAETRLGQLDKAARESLTALGAAREEQARSEERLEALRARRGTLQREIAEALDVTPAGLAKIAGLAAGQAPPARRVLERALEVARAEREKLGAVNLRSEDEQREVQAQLDGLIRERDDLIEAIKRLRQAISGLNKEGRERLLAAFDVVNGHFQTLFATLFGGGTAELLLTESDDPLEAGLDILAKPPGKKPQTLSLLSGGEQALTATALIFAVFLTNPAPICVLDEVDAPLDDANVDRFCDLLDLMARQTETRFVVITHNPISMARMNRLFGVTMAERGISQLVSVELSEAEALADAA